MDAWSGKIQLLRTEFADSFLYLPLLILGFSFLYGLLTSNIGLLYLFLGQVTIVPSLGWLMNEVNPFANANSIMTTLASVAIVFGVISSGAYTLIQQRGLPAPGAAYTLYALPFILAIIKYLGKFDENSIFDLLNPAFLGGAPAMVEPNAVCSIVPGVSKPWTRPSLWTLHVTFFSGYILANATTLYNQAVPIVDDSSVPSGLTGDEYANTLKEKQDEVLTRVGNRQRIATIVGCIVSVVCLVLLWFRFNKTPCESDWRYQIAPLILSIFIGSMTFATAALCGVRPVDVLGLVQGMIQPVAPTVCVASAN